MKRIVKYISIDPFYTDKVETYIGYNGDELDVSSMKLRGLWDNTTPTASMPFTGAKFLLMKPILPLTE